MNTSLRPTLPLPNFTPRLYGIGLLVTVIVLLGSALIWRFAADDYARDVQGWREKLNLIAESRASEVSHWVENHFQELRDLADNPTMQLYLTTLQSAPEDGSPAEDEGQKAYLRHLLLFTANRDGYGAIGPALPIPANVQQQTQGGLAVFNSKNNIIVSTNLSPSLRDKMMQQAALAEPGKEMLIDMYKDEDGKVYMGFLAPVYAIQEEHEPASQIGKVIGITEVTDKLLDLLKHPGVTEKTLEAILIRRVNGQIEYLSSLQDKTGPLSRKNAADTDQFVEAALQQQPGEFIATQKDYRDKPVLATSRAIPHTPWTLVLKLDRKEALTESEQRRNGIITVFALIVVVIVLVVVTVWWQAYSRRSLVQSRYFQKMASQAQQQENLLRLVTDNQPEPIYIVDESMVIQFANKQAASEAGMLALHMVGKPLSEVRGTARAEMIGAQCAACLERNAMMYDTQRITEGKKERIMRFAFIPVDTIPLPGLMLPHSGVLVVEQDITGVVRERERRVATLRQLVRTLIKLVDRRDPHAANHSLLVSELAYQVASAMQLDPAMVETTRLAAKLMNIGKIIVPVELLTKTGPLTEQEKKSIHDSMNSAARLIGQVDFDGPVMDTLQQWQEHWDGTGPLGLKGDDILISARIIAPANAFISMVSPRSWREAMSIETASQHLLSRAGTHFDRNVIIAMLHYIENHHGKSWIRKAA